MSSLAVAVVLAILVTMGSSWHRSNVWRNIPSPFGGSAFRAPEVRDDDFSYVDPDDMNSPFNIWGQGSNVGNPRHGHQHQAVDQDDDQEPDVVRLKYKGDIYMLQFPAFAIGDGLLTVGDIRRAAARTLDVNRMTRIKLIYKGLVLRDDLQAAKSVGIKQNSTIMCVVLRDFGPEFDSTSEDDAYVEAESGSRNRQRGTRLGGRSRGTPGGTFPDRTREGGGDVASSEPPPASRAPNPQQAGPTETGRRKPRKRGKRGAKAQGDESETSSREQPPQPTRTQQAPEPRPAARPSPPLAEKKSPISASAPATPAPPPSASRMPTPSPIIKSSDNPRESLKILDHYVDTVLKPLCEQFTHHPPEDPKHRDMEHKRLSETAMTQVLLKADGIEVDGDTVARQQRKALINKVQNLLRRVDEFEE